MDLVAEILGVEEVVRTEPVTLAELRATDPEAALLVRGRLAPALTASGCRGIRPQLVAMPSRGASGRLDGSSWNPSRS